MPQASPESVRDTLAAIFSQPEFDRALRETAWSRFSSWIGHLFDSFASFTAQSPALAWTIRAAATVAVLLLLVRVGYVLWSRRPTASRTWRGHQTVPSASQPRQLAEKAAADGRYLEAAHLLYAALLQALAAHELLRLHPSRTLGDYTRDLRARSSELSAYFRAFAVRYERTVYGERRCDRERYEELSSLADIPLTAMAPARHGDG